MANLDYCPWCGGGFTDSEIAAANRMRERMEESLSRYRAGDLSVRGLGKPADRPEVATHSEPVFPSQPGVRRVQHHDELPLDSELRGKYLDTTKAAISTMREPTEAMILAAFAAKSDPQYNVAPYLTIWQAMIDAALK